MTGFWNGNYGRVSVDVTVYSEVHNGIGVLSPFAYTDVAVYSALEWNRRENRTGVTEMVGVLGGMWDGRGMVDEAYKSGTAGELGVYQTFKSALYLLLLERLSLPVPQGLVEAVVGMQGLDGGFHTGYDSWLTYAGTKENAETTAIAVLALQEPTPEENLLYLPVALGATISLTVIFFFLNRRRNKTSSSSRASVP